MSRKVVREAVQSWIATAQIETLNQVFTSFPKRIDFQVNSFPGQSSRAAAVVFIESEDDSEQFMYYNSYFIRQHIFAAAVSFLASKNKKRVSCDRIIFFLFTVWSFCRFE